MSYTSTTYPYNPIFATNAEVDFQVQAYIGYRDRGVYSGGIMPYEFYGEKSGWSNAQTLTFAEGQTPAPTPQETPQTEQELIIGVAITVAVIGAGLGLLIYLIKRK
jgi:hypothetical protein